MPGEGPVEEGGLGEERRQQDGDGAPQHGTQGEIGLGHGPVLIVSPDQCRHASERFIRWFWVATSRTYP